MSIFDLSTFSGAFSWVIAHGYPLMFVAMLIEGPVVTAAASFAAAFGYFNVFIVSLLSILGDMISDVLYYALGYFGRIMIVQRYGRFLGLTEDRIRKVEDLLNAHPNKTLIALKLTPVLPTPGLMIVGTTRMPLQKFITVCSVVILPKTVFFVILGYFFGSAYTTIFRQFEKGGLIFAVILFVLIGIYYASRKISGYIARKVEKI